MVKKARKSISEKILITTVLGIVVIASVLFIFNIIGNSEQVRNQQNLELMRKAKDQLDPTLCDQINGGIDKQGPTRPEGHKGINVYANATPAMTEAEAKAKCKSDVQWRIDHSKS